MPLLITILLAAQAGYARPELLVDTAWLAAHLSDDAVRIVDMRPRGYAESPHAAQRRTRSSACGSVGPPQRPQNWWSRSHCSSCSARPD